MAVKESFTTPSSADEHEDIRRIVDGLAKSAGPRYEVTSRGPNVYHLKSGHLSTNILAGCCGQCYKYNVDLNTPGRLVVTSTVPCNGWWGGAIGAGKEAKEKDRMVGVLTSTFPERTVVMG